MVSYKNKRNLINLKKKSFIVSFLKFRIKDKIFWFYSSSAVEKENLNCLRNYIRIKCDSLNLLSNE